jgi:hypothetical protein
VNQTFGGRGVESKCHSELPETPSRLLSCARIVNAAGRVRISAVMNREAGALLGVVSVDGCDCGEAGGAISARETLERACLEFSIAGLEFAADGEQLNSLDRAVSRHLALAENWIAQWFAREEVRCALREAKPRRCRTRSDARIY